MMPVFGKKRSTPKTPSPEFDACFYAETTHLRFGNRGQTFVRPRLDLRISPTESTVEVDTAQPGSSPPTPLRYHHSSGATICQHPDTGTRRDRKDRKKKKLGKRRSLLVQGHESRDQRSYKDTVPKKRPGSALDELVVAKIGSFVRISPLEDLAINSVGVVANTSFVLDPNNLKPQSFKVGYLYKREGTDYKTKRHFRLSADGGLKIYKNEQDKVISPIEEIKLDFMRVELQPGLSDNTTKDPRFFFCLKSDDLSGKSWFLAAESDYERKKWMVSLVNHIDSYCKPSITDLNDVTKEYLGLLNSDISYSTDSESGSTYSEESDSVYQAGVERVPRIAPQIAEPEDELYGEFDPELTGHGHFDTTIPSPSRSPSTMAPTSTLTATNTNPRHSGNFERKTSTTHNIFSETDLIRAPVRAAGKTEEDSTYMGSADFAFMNLRLNHRQPYTYTAGDAMSPTNCTLEEEEEETYLDGFSVPTLAANKRLSLGQVDSSPPALPTGPPPTQPHKLLEQHYTPSSRQVNNHYVYPGRHDFNRVSPNPLSADSDDLYVDHQSFFDHNNNVQSVDHQSFSGDDDLYAAPPGGTYSDAQLRAPPPPSLTLKGSVHGAPPVLPPRSPVS